MRDSIELWSAYCSSISHAVKNLIDSGDVKLLVYRWRSTRLQGKNPVVARSSHILCRGALGHERSTQIRRSPWRTNQLGSDRSLEGSEPWVSASPSLRASIRRRFMASPGPLPGSPLIGVAIVAVTVMNVLLLDPCILPNAGEIAANILRPSASRFTLTPDSSLWAYGDTRCGPRSPGDLRSC